MRSDDGSAEDPAFRDRVGALRAQIAAVLDGDIDPFIEAFLKQSGGAEAAP